MNKKEIEEQLYRNKMRIRSIEAEIERVSPFSNEFDTLVFESLQLQEQQQKLGIKRLEAKLKGE